MDETQPLNAPTAATASAPLPLPFPPLPSSSPSHKPGSSIPTVTITRRPWLAIFSIIALFIAMAGSFVIYFLDVATKSQIATVDNAVTQLDKLIKSPPLSDTTKQLGTFSASLNGYKTAINKKYDYSLFFEQLPKVTPKNMTISNMSVDASGIVHFTGRVPDFESVGKAVLAFQQWPLITHVDLGSLGLTGKDQNGAVSFDIVATIDKTKIKIVKPAVGTAAAAPQTSALPNGATQ